MNNIELNTALLNMGYRYMGVQKDKSHVWGKPIGYTILAAYVTPDMEDVKLSSLCRICEKSGEEMTATYASTKYSECTKDVPIANATYKDFVEFIKYINSGIFPISNLYFIFYWFRLSFFITYIIYRYFPVIFMFSTIF